MPKSGRRSGAALDYVTSGTYNRSEKTNTGTTQTAEAEFEVTQVAVDLAGDGSKDTLWSWIRIQLMLYSSSSGMAYEAVLWRCKTSDALQNLNQAAVDALEKAFKEGRILWHKLWTTPQLGQGVIPIQKIELYQIKLPLDEELRLVVRPIGLSSGAGTGADTVLIEWRQVGL